MSWEQIKSGEDDSENDENDLRARNMRIWSLSKCAKVFSSTLDILKKELKTKDYLMWDKDDNPAMDFVVACANIRANIFSIAQKSRFDVKCKLHFRITFFFSFCIQLTILLAIAGNIIPAIATTNAMIAGLVVLYAFRVLEEEFDKCVSVNVRQKSIHSKTVLSAETTLVPPQSECYVCSARPYVNVFVNVEKMTIREFETEILKKNLNLIAPDVIIDGKGVIVISSEEGETEVS